MRVGIGFDVHPLVRGETLIIGGVHIPAERGLQGHSDADVLTHALIDAILGALGRGDLGQHFPDTEEEYKGINSLLLLERVFSLMQADCYRINNIDLVIMAQVPKMSPYYEEIKRNYAQVLELNHTQINLKATTTERLGFIGREEGIAAQAIVSLVGSKGR
ncbi:MAG: 2-C-methyl-D-erythritol 2,4-cyclodiphosphate synthase [Halanaerobiales bacterium]|nr:2-C-methyl-D-erythritol 2,4-cyclodiphosphate synthase [Halanaerobiales bacterium]